MELYGIYDLGYHGFWIIACWLFGAKPLPEPLRTYCQLNHQEQTSVKLELINYVFHSRKRFESVLCITVFSLVIEVLTTGNA